MQVGGTIGTAVLGAIMSAKVSAQLPTRWAAAHLPALNQAQLASSITEVTHATFISGMSASFPTASVVAVH